MSTGIKQCLTCSWKTQTTHRMKENANQMQCQILTECQNKNSPRIFIDTVSVYAHMLKQYTCNCFDCFDRVPRY